jgi:hypothetical protein
MAEEKTFKSMEEFCREYLPNSADELIRKYREEKESERLRKAGPYGPIRIKPEKGLAIL